MPLEGGIQTETTAFEFSQAKRQIAVVKKTQIEFLISHDRRHGCKPINSWKPILYHRHTTENNWLTFFKKPLEVGNLATHALKVWVYLQGDSETL